VRCGAVRHRNAPHGVRCDTKDGCVGWQERMDPLMGIVTDFVISVPETGVRHMAHVVHLPDGGHVLYVDGYLIPEHTG